MNLIPTFFVKNKYSLVVLAHVLFGAIAYYYPLITRFYSAFLFIFGIYFIVKNRNRNQESLLVCAYVAGSEILIRITDGASYEFAKYTIFLFALLGIGYSGWSKKSYLYFIYLLLLLPGLLLSIDFNHPTRTMINEIALNLFGPVCIGFLSIYTLGNKISFQQLSDVLLAVGLPILSACVYVFIFSPDVSTIISVESNGYFSGMFGPNQVATALGLGMFIFFLRTILNSESKIKFGINLLIGSFLCYCGLLSFSRAGMITGACVFIVACLFLYIRSESYGKSKTKIGLIAFSISLFAMFMTISYQTDGLLKMRYTNRDHLGRIKKDKKGDRKELAKEEVQIFIQNPVFGVGIAEGEKIRIKNHNGRKFSSHDEITRMLAEHGSLGFLGILILIVTPIGLFFYAKQNIFLATFYVFWFLTINHSGLRLAAPAFFYALMLLHVDVSQTAFFSRKIDSDWSYRQLFSLKRNSSLA